MNSAKGKRPDGIIFDLDGTLADTVDDIRAALNVVLAERGLMPLERDKVRMMIGRGPVVLIERALRHLGVEYDDELVAELKDRFIECYGIHGNPHSELFDGARQCLDKLEELGVPLGVCSNKPHEFCVTLLRDLGIDGRFRAINGSTDDVPKKPDPAMLQRTLAAMNVDPSRALYVGDSVTDVNTARAAGVPVALVSYGYSDVPVESLGPDCTISSLQELNGLFG
jgi:phosphoglycolate phosphatase